MGTKTKQAKTAALYWPTSSVGGINTELRAFRDAADARGDVFHVIKSANATGHIKSYPGRKLIRGGDTFITIDGEAHHGTNRVQQSVDYIAERYNRVYLAYICPHPTKDYGDTPAFLALLAGLQAKGLPITARVTDGYWDTYAEWGERTLALCDAVTVSQPAFATTFKHPRVAASRFPFSPRPAKPATITLGGYSKAMTAKRAVQPLTVWTSQWKAIKGIHKLLPHLPKIKHDVELYSNGILYYQLRASEDWKRAVGRDYFGATTPSGAFDGMGKAPFYGYVPLEVIPTVLSRAWFMIDLMGSGNPKNKVYQDGSFNNTTVEALWYGCCPVLHSQAGKVVPSSIALFVNDAEQVPDTVNSPANQRFATDPKRIRAAREWVHQHFDADKVYRLAVLGERK